MPRYMPVAAATLILLSGCNAGTETDKAGAGSMNQTPSTGPAPSSGAAGPERMGNEAQPAQAGDTPSASPLEASTPSGGARLSASPENLVLNFRMPVRLEEVAVHASDGQTMPMMITAAGLLRSFSIPLPYLEPGSYSVRWRATDEAGGSHEGSLSFTIT